MDKREGGIVGDEGKEDAGTADARKELGRELEKLEERQRKKG